MGYRPPIQKKMIIFQYISKFAKKMQITLHIVYMDIIIDLLSPENPCKSEIFLCVLFIIGHIDNTVVRSPMGRFWGISWGMIFHPMNDKKEAGISDLYQGYTTFLILLHSSFTASGRA